MNNTPALTFDQLHPLPAESGGQYGGDLLRIFMRHKWVILGTMAAVTAAAILFAAVWPSTYRATASLIIATSGPDPRLPAGSGSLASLDDRLIDSQVELLGDRPLARKVVRDLELVNSPEFGPRFSNESSRAVSRFDPAAIDATVDTLRRHVDVRRVDRSAVITITAAARSPELAAQIANKFAADHIVLQRREVVASRRSAIAALEPRVEALRLQAIAADRAVADYRRSHDLLGATDGGDSVEMGRLAGALTDARSSRSEAVARAGSAAVSGAINAASSPLLTDLQRQAAEVGKRVADLSTAYGHGYPERVSAEAQLQDINRRIAVETARVARQLQAEAAINRVREGQISSDLGSLRARSSDQRAATVRLLDLERDAAATNAQYVAMLAQLKQLGVETGTPTVPARLLARAVPPSEASFPKRPEIIGVALVGSFLLGLVLAMAVEQIMENRIRTADQLERLLGIPTLGMIPAVEGEAGKAPHLSLFERPRSVFSESMRSLYLDLRQRLPAGQSHVIVVTSPLPGEGKTTLTLSLASAAAALSRSVAVIDFDLRRPGLLTSRNQPADGPDLADFLNGTADIGEILRSDLRAPGVTLIGMNHLADDPGALLSSPRLAELFDKLRLRFELVVVNAPPILAVRDARTLAESADAALLVLRWGKTPSGAVRAAARKFQGQFIGAVINQVDFRRHADAGYGDAVQHHNACVDYYFEGTEKAREPVDAA